MRTLFARSIRREVQHSVMVAIRAAIPEGRAHVLVHENGRLVRHTVFKYNPHSGWAHVRSVETGRMPHVEVRPEDIKIDARKPMVVAWSSKGGARGELRPCSAELACIMTEELKAAGCTVVTTEAA